MSGIAALCSVSINTAVAAEDADEKRLHLVAKSEKPRALNLQLHSRVYLTSYVRYLCRTKSHLCRSQNKLLIIEIRRISRRYVNGLHTVGEACRECRRTCSFWRRTRRILSYVMQSANRRHCHRTVLSSMC